IASREIDAVFSSISGPLLQQLLIFKACASNDDDTLLTSENCSRMSSRRRLRRYIWPTLASDNNRRFGQWLTVCPAVDEQTLVEVSPQLVPGEIEEHRATRCHGLFRVSPNGDRQSVGCPLAFLMLESGGGGDALYSGGVIVLFTVSISGIRTVPVECSGRICLATRVLGVPRRLYRGSRDRPSGVE
uniref:POPLD domain-containing protein n=1 Tax=Macrostomum lignano TaxID=282301 RepID=A0A1I8IZF8_9PLAT